MLPYLKPGSHGSPWPCPEVQPRDCKRTFWRTKEREKGGEKPKDALGFIEIQGDIKETEARSI